MLQKLSYSNLVLAMVYLLVYLKSGTFNSTAGIFVVIVFNWLCLRSYQLDNYKWKIWHYLTGLWSLYFIGTIIYGSVFILSSSLEYSFISNDTLIYLLISIVFSLSVLLHLGVYVKASYKAVS
ncbi:hypothetical protein [Pedobacter sp. UC225_65]|uniref:hypothetical protein n=1 Tax=Pedobacter sp. UC225_65 TaxID=3350173 RepID=UPI0036709C90